MSISGNALRAVAATAALAVLLAGCNGHSTVAALNPVNTNPPVAPPVVAEEIHGVATPSSVAVVTATNAQ